MQIHRFSLFLEPLENDGAAAGMAHRASNLLFPPISLLKTEAPEFILPERNVARCPGWQLLWVLSSTSIRSLSIQALLCAQRFGVILFFHHLINLSFVLLFPPPFCCLAYFSAYSQRSQASESWAASGQTPRIQTSSKGHESPIWEVIKNCSEK